MNLLRKAGLLNLLLIFAPAALVLDGMGAAEIWIFVTSAIAIIPLAGLMGKSTERLADRLGPGIGGLLNASFGNAAELIIAFFALERGLISVVKASITGSILGNALLVLGASFLAGGMRYRRQTFNATAAGMSATLLTLAAIGLLIPAIFHASMVMGEFTSQQQQGWLGSPNHREQDVSLDISIVLFTVYILMLLFSLKTHKHLYENEEVRSQQEPTDFADVEGAWPPWVAVTVLLTATAFMALMSELLVGAIEATKEQLGWTELFVGVVVVAIVGNAAEHSTAVRVAMKNHMELSIQIAVGSALQIALFVAPLLVFISYLPGLPQLDLVFSMLEVVAIGASVLIVGLVAYDGESNWLEGLLLLAVYVILAIAFYHLPEAHQAQTTDHSLSSISTGRDTGCSLSQTGSFSHSGCGESLISCFGSLSSKKQPLAMWSQNWRNHSILWTFGCGENKRTAMPRSCQSCSMPKNPLGMYFTHCMLMPMERHFSTSMIPIRVSRNKAKSAPSQISMSPMSRTATPSQS